MPDPVKRLRDRAFLALLLLVGAAALGSGLVVLLGQGQITPTAVFDSVLGLTVLVVSWVFLGPYVVPDAFGDPMPGDEEVDRPYLPLPIVAPTPPPEPRPVGRGRPFAVSARPNRSAPSEWEEPIPPTPRPAPRVRPSGVAAWVTAPWDDAPVADEAEAPERTMSSPPRASPRRDPSPPGWAGVVLPDRSTPAPSGAPALDPEADPSILHELDEIWSSTRHGDGLTGPIPSVEDPVFPEESMTASSRSKGTSSATSGADPD